MPPVQFAQAAAAYKQGEVAHPAEHVALEVEAGHGAELIRKRVPSADRCANRVQVVVDQLPEVALREREPRVGGKLVHEVAALAEEGQHFRERLGGVGLEGDAVAVDVESSDVRVLEVVPERAQRLGVRGALGRLDHLGRVEVEEPQPIV
jgi:hypothetical protein